MYDELWLSYDEAAGFLDCPEGVIRERAEKEEWPTRILIPNEDIQKATADDYVRSCIRIEESSDTSHKRDMALLQALRLAITTCVESDTATTREMVFRSVFDFLVHLQDCVAAEQDRVRHAEAQVAHYREEIRRLKARKPAK